MQEQTLTIPGPAGGLEALLVQPAGWRETDPITICCHPHPLHGGTMHNKVVYILAKTCHELSSATLRFNFRGVGQSQGEFDHAVGEQADALAIADWLQQHFPQAPLWLGGFSFGGYVSIMTHTQIKPARLVVIAPAIEMYPAMQQAQVQTQDWILIQGGKDELVSPTAVRAWLEQQRNKPQLIWLEEAGHLFHGHLNKMQEQILSLWQPAE